jgi:dephospho-CoA kinase
MIVGLTGGIAAGKSTVGAHLRTLGATVIDADQVARDVVSPGSTGLAEIVASFGPDILQPNGTLNREALAAVVLQDDQARKRLESITHPKIRRQIAQRAQEALSSGSPAVFVEAALLVETGSAKLYPDLWVVRCSLEHQIQRLMNRKGCDQTTAQSWINTQMSADEKAKHATVVIDNDGDIGALRQRVDAAFQELREPRQDQD